MAAAVPVAAARGAGGDLMWWTRQKHLSRDFDGDAVANAIAAAEHQTSGQVVVSISPFFIGSVRRAADRAFLRLGVANTRAHNGVLFFIVPSRRQFIVLGDDGIHRAVGQTFWDDVAAAVSKRFARGDMTAGLVDGIAEVGRQLAAHFPHDDADERNELPDAIDYGGTTNANSSANKPK